MNDNIKPSKYLNIKKITEKQNVIFEQLEPIKRPLKLDRSFDAYSKPNAFKSEEYFP
jgi:hypothetical protein